jgi:hypothetical protein
MRHEIRETSGTVKIEVSDTGTKRQALLNAFRECAEGRCTCPTTEYTKLDSLQVDPAPEAVVLTLKPKSGQRFDLSAVERCVEHSIQSAEPGANRP